MAVVALSPRESGRSLKALIFSCPQDVCTNYGFTTIRVLDKGMMSQVILAQPPHGSGLPLQAVKTLSKKTQDGGKLNLKLFMQEVSVLQSIKHKYILGHVNAFDCPEEYTVCMPYYKNGTLTARISSLTIGVIDQYLLQLTSAVLYLHNHNLVHRDIKPDNVLISDEGNVILADFGLASVVDPRPTSPLVRCGTREYMAPELLDPKRRSESIDLYKCDMYSLGAVLWDMIFHGLTPPAGSDFLTFLEDQRHIPASYRNVMQQLLHPDSNIRWDSNKLVLELSKWPQMVALFEKHWC